MKGTKVLTLGTVTMYTRDQFQCIEVCECIHTCAYTRKTHVVYTRKSATARMQFLCKHMRIVHDHALTIVLFPTEYR